MQLSNNRTRLHFDGVQSTITADVTRRRDDGMVVTQALPFLRLDTSVTESGRRSRIKRVTIAMDGDVPQLLLELLHEGSDATVSNVARSNVARSNVARSNVARSNVARSNVASARPDERRSDEDTLESFTPGMSTRPARTDSTVPYGFRVSPGLDSLAIDSIVLRDSPSAPEPQPSWFTRTWHWMLSALPF